MDTKRLITMMLISFAVIFGWQIIVAKMYERHPEWKRPGQTNTAQTTTAPSAVDSGLNASPSTQASSTQASGIADSAPVLPPSNAAATTPVTPSAITQADVRIVSPATQPTVATIGNTQACPLTVEISSTGAGLKSVTLKDFKAAGGQGVYIFQEPYDPSNPLTRSMATRAVTVNGTELPLAGVQWNLEKHDEMSATFSLDLGLVRVRKIFTVEDRTSAGKGFELAIRHEIESTSDKPATVKLTYSGPLTPPRETERGPDLQILAGYDTGYEKIALTHHAVEEYDAKNPQRDMTKGPDNAPLLWGGATSVYFAAFLRVEPLDPATFAAKYLANVTATAVNADSAALDRHVILTFETGDLQIEPRKSLSLGSSLYLGPRWRHILYDPHYATFPLSYDETLVLTSGPCAYCTFQFLINGLVKLLGFFHWILRDWGLAIIALVVLVRTLLHPITKKSQMSMMKMGKLGPEVERLKKKYGDDKDELNRQMMGLYKDQGVGMYLGCLPMFLQMPIWIALWSALQSTFELRQAPFLRFGSVHLTWITDLARPDRLIDFGRTINLPLGMHISALNLLPILLGVVFFLQQKFTPKPPASTPEQLQQQKMMQWMSLLFPVFLYNGPSGLNLYIFTSTTIGIIESKRIRDHIKQKDEEEKAGKIIIDAPNAVKRRRDGDDSSKPDKQPKTGFAGLLAKMQAKAEELKREADRGGKK